MALRLVIVTASTMRHLHVEECMKSWHAETLVCCFQKVRPSAAYTTATHEALARYVGDYLAPVPAFAWGVRAAYHLLEPDDIIACLHDDLLIEDPNWQKQVIVHFDAHPESVLVGFGGAKGLGAEDIYKAPYDPYQLARQDYISNMKDAEAHGRRVYSAEQVACLDGFSQIGRARFMLNSFSWLESRGFRHHCYDSVLGALAKRAGGEVWMLPVPCHHYGGQTAVGDPGYAAWAKTQHADGDAGFWQESHLLAYNSLRDQLPIRIP